ncbi:MAG: 16S rRNA (guanine(966)-N(2))-methyltransferase RsmD [Armatimonadota bacterium]|nr:16S rRNA (guanine(966)-N(2))-methyltransferase RsmD [Armatimonadota bacterium]MDR7447618.1 16S rRNA (guanine(966)-N(2))-methyltransferase RsmD [Armatimonadota bacterium]MDR7459501.1 16S rRNA (guanine(966)-N(2))-methyltransferase RsmD [Armatimonadota bacterium]MDR7480479.1 16S rRNA (guanine(966)-N(2))-methyltransferase RsmD [Armatimonadota bacterium]MDR7492011.1 16S rRNA (guanine(966)-N(2))-methyltransferase RsmD [Armatimonadota bacterium]
MRPTAARVREALFNSLGARTVGADVLDLFAGTGALGLEALRRGAASAVFVERDARLADQIRAAARAFPEAAVEVWRADVAAALGRLAAAGRAFDLILLDPPYGTGALQATLDALAAGPLLRPGGRVVAEGHWRETPRTPPGWRLVREARYGETGLWFFTQAADDAEEGRA